MTDDPKRHPIIDDLKRHHEAAHAMQSGVSWEIEVGLDYAAATPKQLRTGINAAMSDQCGLVTLLIAKGVFTKEEYVAALANSMEDEKKRYEEKLSERLGKKITLA